MEFALSKFNSSIWVPILFLLLATLYQPSHGVPGFDRRMSLDGSVRRIFGIQRTNQAPNCAEMVSLTQCSQNSNCRWCRSEDLEDICFSKAEAWRLPLQAAWLILARTRKFKSENDGHNIGMNPETDVLVQDKF
ncbi:E3 ubiquitin-protein like [Quillaja saponaria]|uniref:E3 ubiquitin-protein like n=1 Tax=Quillaja saponaria TaxID=32244 RepID=A0AAD7M2M4_QUISA|nr:E3 ubiquitin-protein like [Quillaja saponaria]